MDNKDATGTAEAADAQTTPGAETTPIEAAQTVAETQVASGTEAAAETPVAGTQATSGAVSPEAVQPVAPVANMGGEGNAKKKAPVAAIAGVAAGVVVLGGVGAFAYTSSRPENVALSAFSNFMNAKTISLSGTISALQESSYTSGYVAGDTNTNKVELTFKSDAQKLSNSTTASVSVKTADMEEAIDVDLGAVFIDDGTLYLKVDKLKDALNKAVESSGDSSSAYIVELILGDLVGDIEGQWWKISVDEVTEGLVKNGVISNSDKSKVDDGWACALDYLKESAERQSDVANIYKDNQFITLRAHEGDLKSSAGISLDEFKKAGSLYDLSLDAAKLTSFANAAVGKMDTDSLTSCLVDKGVISESTKEETEEVKQEDVEKALENMPSIVVATSGLFSHKLTGFYVDYAVDNSTSYKEDNTKLTAALMFDYPGSVSISAPGDAKPVMELVNTVSEKIEALNSSTYNNYDYDYNYEDYGI